MLCLIQNTESAKSGRGDTMEIIFARPQDSAAWAVCESYLLGLPPERGTIICYKKAFYIDCDCFEIKGEEIPGMPVPVITTLDSEEKTVLAVREFMSGRRLPVGTAVAFSAKGIFVFSEKEWTPSGPFEELKWPETVVQWVMTAEEAEEKYGLPDKKARNDCKNNLFSPGEARKSGPAWLITAEAADRMYGTGKEKIAPVNPFLLVFSTAEAGILWNRDGGDVRAAAAGAGHRAARLFDGDRRQSGRTWLVTRMAMDRLYGPADPGKMKALAETLRSAGAKTE